MSLIKEKNNKNKLCLDLMFNLKGTMKKNFVFIL